MKRNQVLALCCVILCQCWFNLATASEARIAVASNFIAPAKHLAKLFHAQTGNQVVLIFGSTGKHYAQINQGAPFDAWLAADAQRPQLLKAKSDHAASPFTYAIGKLALFNGNASYPNLNQNTLRQGNFTYLAIANPRLAPYGLAAQQTLIQLNLWQALQTQLVRGENINQTFQFVRSGNAELGFVAYSQIYQTDPKHYWLVPQSLYSPIEQQALLLTSNPVADDFLTFLRSEKSLAIIRQYGYDTP